MSRREEKPARAARRPQAWAPRLLAAAWILLGMLALGHMFGVESYFEPPKTLTARFEGPAEIHSTDPVLRDLQTTISTLTAKTTALDAKITALENALGPPTAAISPETLRPTMPPRPLEHRESPEAATPPPPVRVAYAPLPSSGFGDTDATASPVPIAAGIATQTVFGIELGNSPNPDKLSQTWANLLGRENETLGNLEPRQVATTTRSGQQSWSLVAGPFSNAADAAKACARLKAEKLFCREAVFAGEPLVAEGQPVP